MSAAVQACGMVRYAFSLFSSTIAVCLYLYFGGPWTLIPHFGRSEYEMLWGHPFLLLSSIYPHGTSLGLRLTYRYTSAASRASKLRFLARHGDTNTSSVYMLGSFALLVSRQPLLDCDSHFLSFIRWKTRPAAFSTSLPRFFFCCRCLCGTSLSILLILTPLSRRISHVCSNQGLSLAS